MGLQLETARPPSAVSLAGDSRLTKRWFLLREGCFGDFGGPPQPEPEEIRRTPLPFFVPTKKVSPKHTLASKSETLRKTRSEGLDLGKWWFLAKRRLFWRFLEAPTARTRRDTGKRRYTFLILPKRSIQNTNYLQNRRHFEKLDMRGWTFGGFL